MNMSVSAAAAHIAAATAPHGYMSPPPPAAGMVASPQSIDFLNDFHQKVLICLEGKSGGHHIVLLNNSLVSVFSVAFCEAGPLQLCSGLEKSPFGVFHDF